MSETSESDQVTMDLDTMADAIVVVLLADLHLNGPPLAALGTNHREHLRQRWSVLVAQSIRNAMGADPGEVHDVNARSGLDDGPD